MAGKGGSASFLLSTIARGKHHLLLQFWPLDQAAPRGHRASTHTCRADLQNPQGCVLVETGAEGCQDPFLPAPHVEPQLLATSRLWSDDLQEVPTTLDRAVFFVG